jgi:hypothetical protein
MLILEEYIIMIFVATLGKTNLVCNQKKKNKF